MWIALALSISLQAPAPTPPLSSRFVTSTGLRVRAAPRADAEVVEKIAIGSVVTCLARSAPQDVGGTTGAFCRVRVGEKEGWVFEPLTEPLEADRSAQEERLIAARLREQAWTDRARWPDLYELHRFALARVDAAADRPAKMRARLLELTLVSMAPEAFHADKRIYRDEAQGLRVRMDALRALEREAAGTPTAEEVAWLLVQIGKPFECEGYMPCVLAALADIECGYLARYPAGAHATSVRARVEETLSWAVEFAPGSDMPVDDARDHLVKVERCLAALPKGEGALGLALATKLRAVLEAKPKQAPPAAR